MNNRYCVIMCGGVGSRFWPRSRQANPKQFIDFLGTGRSLLQMTVDRLEGIVPRENIIMMTNAQYANQIKEQLPDITDNQILLEPARRNTAPCIAWASWHIRQINPDAAIMVAPSDHLILNLKQFTQSVLNAFNFLQGNKNALLTFGVKPSRPETGYGYIQLGDHINDDFYKVKTFTEKPDLEMAKVLVESGEFLWNSGMFFWNVRTIIDAFHNHAPVIAEIFDQEKHVYNTDAETVFIANHYPECPNISIDYAVMEKSSDVFVQAVDFGWSDLGTWGSLFETSPKNRAGNVAQNCTAMTFESSGNVIAVDNPDKLIVVSGLNDYIVADAEDVLLIVPKSDEQKIKTYVNEVHAAFGDKYL